MGAELLRSLDDLIESDPKTAVGQLRERLAAEPFDAGAYRLLARAMRELEQQSNAQGEVRTFVRGLDPRLVRAGNALSADDLETAEVILRRYLLERPVDAHALYLMARLASILDFALEGENLLRLALEVAPSFVAARVELARELDRRHLPLEASEELRPILTADPDNDFVKALLASALGRAGKFDEALDLYEEMLESMPAEPKLWSSYGHFLKTVGRSDEGYRAMRRAVSVAPGNGEAWWTLSNLKTANLGTDDIEAMKSALESSGATDHDRFHLHFALGKALEDAGEAGEAFAHYDRANAIRRQSWSYRAEILTTDVNDSIRFFSKAFFEQRRGFGSTARDPIFVLGMPRAGSTLIEQILASHPDVEGTTELPDIPLIAKKLGGGSEEYFRSLATLDAEAARMLGETYIERTRVQRKTSRPFFVDKMPNNWGHVPLIHLILPNAKIIDARRHPLACGFSNFKQLYVDGHTFSYDLTTIGHYYSEYVRLMAHVDEVLPGQVHRVIHEQLLGDTEREVRRMLNYLELSFDPACLRFWETERAVRTPSSEQVRNPINRKSVDGWRAFEPWLDPLKDALGPVLDAYPDAPAFPSK